MTRDSAKSLRHPFFLIVTLTLLILSTILLFPRPAHADEGGGWIGTGGIGESGGSGGSISVNDCGKNNRYKYMLECTGYSWVFYRNTGWKAGDVYFVPHTPDESRVEIPQECSEHSDQNGGFWHLGRNVMASHPDWADYAYFADNDYAGYYGSNDSSKYYTTGNSWGHLGTYQYGFVPNAHNWATYMGDGSQIPDTNIQLSSSNLYHYLYKDGTRVYYATKYGTINQVFEDYKKAYRYIHNGATPSDMNGVWGFCYWDGMGETNNVTFTLKSIDDQGASLSHLMPDRTKTVPPGSSVTLSVGLLEGYTKTKWGDSTNPSTWVDSNNLTFHVPSLKQNLTKYAVYHRNEFKGRATVYEGTDTSSPNNSNTGYVSDDTTAKTLNINCDAGSCQASFRFFLRPSGTLGETYYKISRNGSVLSNHNNVKIIPRLFGQQVAGFVETLTPGQTICYTLEFKPYGNKPNHTYTKAKVCAHATASTFEGKSDLTGATSGSTNWQKTNTDRTFYIPHCSATNGCKVTFRHSLRRVTGAGTTNWHVARTSNLIVSPKAIAPNPNIANGNFDPGPNTNNGKEIRIRTSEQLTLYPGMVICEKLYFHPTSTSTSSVRTGICASALGKAQPDDPDDPDVPEDPNYPSGDSSYINIKVRNGSVSRYHNFQREVYAKPGDELTYRATYNPVLQYTYHIIPQRMRINSGPIYPISGRNTSATLVAMYNLYKTNDLRNWNNGFSVAINNALHTAGNHTFTPGDTTRRSETNDHTVTSSEAGTSFNESAWINLNQFTQTTPTQVTFSNINDDNTAVMNTGARAKTAFARIPYNFINTTEITKDPDDVLYAGETANIDFDIKVKSKRNSITQGFYATIVRNAEWELMVCYNGHCSVTDKNIGNKTGNLLPGSTNRKNISINVPDVPAGTEICVSSMVYPANSGADANWQDPSGSRTWAYSPQRCFKVAKRPSIQAWGGALYSRGAINMTDTIKNNLANYTDYQLEGAPHKNYVFGSWAEHGIVASGSIKGLSSGASLGYNSNHNNDLWPSYHPVDGNGNNQSIGGRPPGGSNKKSLCDRSPLTFSNTCTNGFVGSLGSVEAASNAVSDKSAIISTFLFGGNANITDPNNVTLNHEANRREGTNIYYYNGGNSRLTIPRNVANKNTIQIIHTKHNVTINGNLEYQDNYSTLEEIPKLIIYTDREIRIGCNVTRLDAVLISDSLLTCNNLGGDTITNDNIRAKINDSVNSNQLKINGAVITGKLYSNRTYGASTGANSIIPAEIINFDPSLYTWGTTMNTNSTTSTNDKKSNLSTTYQKELAPRY